MVDREARALSAVRGEIREGDLLLFRGRGIASRLIQIAGRSLYSHAAMVATKALLPRDYQCLEMRAGGGRVSSLESQVEAYPGQIDVFAANSLNRWPDWNSVRTVMRMRRFVGRRYGWWSLAGVALLHLPFVRCVFRAKTDDQLHDGAAPFCSQAIAAACRAGGVDPVPSLADRLTEPGDLARSSFFQYRFTLVPG